jgi:hypothetical protein
MIQAVIKCEMGRKKRDSARCFRLADGNMIKDIITYTCGQRGSRNDDYSGILDGVSSLNRKSDPTS